MKTLVPRKTLRLSRTFACIISTWLVLVTNLVAVVPTTIISESGPETLEGYKLQGSGLMWWKNGHSASESDPGVEGLVGIRRVLQGVSLNLSSSRTFYPLRGRDLSAPTGGVERVGDNLFYFQRGALGKPRIYRRSVYGTADTAIDFSGIAYDQAGAMASWGGRLYWSVRSGGRMELHSKPLDAGPGGGDQIEFFLNEDVAKKIVVVNELLDDGRHFATHLALLTTGGNLYLYEVQGQLAGQPPRLLSGNVSDFAVRNESTFELFEPSVFGTVFYMAMGANLSSTRTSGKLVVYDYTAGPSSTFVMFDTGNRDSQVTSVAVDQNRIFMTLTPVTPAGMHDRFNSAVWGRLYPANRLVPFGATTPFGALFIEPVGASLEAAQLASDGQWLYWIHFNQIRKIPTDTPTFSLDYAALDLEAVQAVQDQDNAVPLVAGKPTLVRGYGRITANSLNLTGLKVKARLGVIHNDNLIGEVYADNVPLIDANDAPIILRPDLKRSFNFYVPGELVRGGPMRFEMTINPNRTIPETGGGAPLANNSVNRSYEVLNVNAPCLVFVTMDSAKDPDYTLQSPGFWSILDRTLSMFPVPNFHVRTIPGALSKPTLFGTEPYSMPADEDPAMIWLTLFHALHRPIAGCTDTHWVGMFPPADRPWNGKGGIPNVSLADMYGPLPFNLDVSIPNTPHVNTLIARMEPGQGSSSGVWNSIQGGHTLAHELGHNYGRFHIDQTLSLGCGISKPKRPWHTFPGDPCTLGQTLLSSGDAPIGYDSLNDALVWPNMAGDVMSYANSSWISPFTWNALLNVLPKLPNPPAFAAAQQATEISPSIAAGPLPPESIFFVQGSIRPWDRTAVIYPALALPAGIADPTKMQELFDAMARIPANAAYRLRLIGNPAAAPLAEAPILFVPTTDGDSGATAFAQPLNAVPGVTRIQVVQEQQVLAEWVRSANPPEVTLNAPVIDSANESLTMTWTVTDRDGDPVYFTTQFTYDNGATWEMLQVNNPTLGLAVSTRTLHGGNQCRLRVIATDGLNTTIATSTPFALAKQGPAISFTGIADQQLVPFGSKDVVRFFAYDAEDGNIDQLSWTLAGRLTRGNIGNTISLAALEPGPYTLGLFANDSDGNISSMAIQFNVLPLAVPDGVIDLVDGLANDPGYAEAPTVRFIQSPEREARFVHTNGSLYVSVSGLRVSDPNATPASLQILIDKDASGGSAPQLGDLGFTIDESGFVTQLRGTGSGMAAEASPDPSLRSEILHSENTWDLELAIPENLLGGWSHAARLMLYYQRHVTVIGSGVSVPDSPSYWPFANPGQPATWSDIFFGSLPIITSNNIPHAVATAPPVVSLSRPEIVHLDGGGSYDPDGDPLTYSWLQIAGPTVALSSAAAVQPTFNTPNVAASTTLRFQLTVSDGEQFSAPATVSVTLIPLANPPVTSPIVSLNKGDGSATARLRWAGSPGDRVVIHASTDLVDWVIVGTNTVGFLESILYTDMQAGLFPHRFYRAQLLPSAPPPTSSQLHFDGVNDSVEIPHSAALNTLPLTITAWVKTTQSTGTFPGIITKYDGSAVRGYGIGLDQGTLSCWYIFDNANYMWDGGAAAGMPFIADGNWHHVAYVANAAGGQTYVDGSLVRTTTWNGSPSATTTASPLRFGVYVGGTGLFFNGSLDEVAVWNRSLTVVEINQMIPGKLTGVEAGLLGFWPLDESVGQVAGDASGNARHGTLQNGPLWLDSTAPLRANPAAGGALRFDGADDVVTVSHQGALNAFPLTVAAWIKTAKVAFSYVAVANKYPAGSGSGYSLHIHNGRIAAFYFRDFLNYVYAGDPGMDGGFIADGQWHYVAFVVDGAGGRIYVDGAQTGSLGWTGTPGGCFTQAPLVFGNYQFGSYLDGRIDEPTLWNRALDATEISALMHFKPTGAEAGLIGYWPFDNGTGTIATDATGHGHNGALQFGPIWVPSDAPVYP